MNAKTVFTTALLVTAFGFGAVRGQTPGAMNPLDTVPPPGVSNYDTDAKPALTEPSRNFQLSSWIRGDKYCCCGPCGGNGPIQAEAFIRSGPSVPLGNGTLADVLQTGFYVGGGMRTLFFDQSQVNAWTVELGVANIYNHAHRPNNYPGIPLNILVPNPTAGGPPLSVSFGKNGVPGVTLEAFNRTFFDVGVGREWYLWGSASNHGPNCRIGCDSGGRWGTARAEFNEIPHRTDTIGGIWVSAHADLEIPCGCCMFQSGFRFEYDYTWSDILQIQNKSDVQDLNFLFTVGLRF
jgi:hypothetical protein